MQQRLEKINYIIIICYKLFADSVTIVVITKLHIIIFTSAQSSLPSILTSIIASDIIWVTR